MARLGSFYFWLEEDKLKWQNSRHKTSTTTYTQLYIEREIYTTLTQILPPDSNSKVVNKSPLNPVLNLKVLRNSFANVF